MLVTGCVLGDDAEAITRNGFAVTAFAISPEVIAWCQRRSPSSDVRFTVAKALALPKARSGQIHLFVEIYKLQSLPDETLRMEMAEYLVCCVALNGSLLVICGGRDQHDQPGSMPLPLACAELAMLGHLGLQEASFEDLRGKKQRSSDTSA